MERQGERHERPRIVVVGSINQDIILKVPHFADVGETVTATSLSYSGGGKGANQAVQAAKLRRADAGESNKDSMVYFLGCVGSDQFGKSLLSDLAGYGVNRTYVRESTTVTGVGMVQARGDGELHSYIVEGANYALTKDDIDRATELFSKATAETIFIFQNEIKSDVNAYAIQKAKAYGAKIILNAAPARTIDEETLSALDILIVNEVEASFYTGVDIRSIEIAKAEIVPLSKRYGIDVIFTLGKRGAVLYEQAADKVTHIPAKEVEAVETTGAGDAFVGALAHALSEGKSLVDACHFATECSAVTVQGVGAQQAMPYLKDVAAYL